MQKYFYSLLILLFVFSSCITKKEIAYVQTTGTNTEVNSVIPTYTIRPNDNLFVKITSFDEKSYAFFNNIEVYGSMQNINELSLFINSYTVQENGEIVFPYLGALKVVGLTTQQAQKTIEQALSSYLTQANVSVKLVNFKVTLLGEVKNPGEKIINDDHVTLFDVIGKASDLTDYGNRRNITLIRETPQGNTIHYIDLTKPDVLSSSTFYLQPNDVIYVTPLKAKSYDARSITIPTILSAITTTFLVLNFFSK